MRWSRCARPSSAAERAQLIERMLHAEPPRPRQLDPPNSPRPGDDHPQGDRQGAGAALPDGGRAGQLTCSASWPTGRSRPGGARRPSSSVGGAAATPGWPGPTSPQRFLTTIVAIGSTLAAWTFHDQRDQIGRHLGHIQEAETKGRERLLESLTAQASAERHSRQLGQRFDSLDALAQAAAIARELKLPASGSTRSAMRRSPAWPCPT